MLSIDTAVIRQIPNAFKLCNKLLNNTKHHSFFNSIFLHNYFFYLKFAYLISPRDIIFLLTISKLNI